MSPDIQVFCFLPIDSLQQFNSPLPPSTSIKLPPNIIPPPLQLSMLPPSNEIQTLPPSIVSPTLPLLNDPLPLSTMLITTSLFPPPVDISAHFPTSAYSSSSYEWKHRSWSTTISALVSLCPVDMPTVAVRGHSRLLVSLVLRCHSTRSPRSTSARIPAPKFLYILFLNKSQMKGILSLYVYVALSSTFKRNVADKKRTYIQNTILFLFVGGVDADQALVQFIA